MGNETLRPTISGTSGNGLDGFLSSGEAVEFAAEGECRNLMHKQLTKICNSDRNSPQNDIGRIIRGQITHSVE